MTNPEPSIRVVRSMKARVTRDVALSQIAFAFFIAVCVALRPGLVIKTNEGGMSNYGVHLKTVVPYTLALVLASALSYRATRFLQRARIETRHFDFLLRTYSALILLTLLTTYGYTLSTAQKDLHGAVGVAVTVFELVASLWMYRAIRSLHLAFAITLIGFVLAALTFFGALHVLFLTQVLVGGAFAVLLVRTSRLLG